MTNTTTTDNSFIAFRQHQAKAIEIINHPRYDEEEKMYFINCLETKVERDNRLSDDHRFDLECMFVAIYQED